LKGELQGKLDHQFQEGLLVVDHLVRRGSYPYTEEGDDRPRLLIYYDVRLMFTRDAKLTDWDQLNVGSLISVLGATPLGVRGVNPEGNRKGDYLEVYGTSAYVREGDRWSPVAVAHPEKRKGGEEPRQESLPYQRHLVDLDEVAREFNRRRDQAGLAALTGDLEIALATSSRRLARSRNRLTIASGSPVGEYHALARALKGTLAEAGRKAEVFETNGSAENVQLVQAREVMFGFVQNDIAHMARAGTGLFQGRLPAREVTAVCALYPEAVQIVVAPDSGIVSVADLAGKRVDLGLPDSGVRVNALQVLEASGLGLSALGATRERGLDEALSGLEGGDVDAVFFTAAHPARALARLFGEGRARLVSLGPDLVKRLTEHHPFFIPVTIPARTYPGLTEDCVTVGVTAMVVTHKETTSVRVMAFLEHLFSQVPRLSRESLQAYYLSRDKGLSGISIPLHPGAQEFFRPDR